jgi:hypothetical protein
VVDFSADVTIDDCVYIVADISANVTIDDCVEKAVDVCTNVTVDERINVFKDNYSVLCYSCLNKGPKTVRRLRKAFCDKLAASCQAQFTSLLPDELFKSPCKFQYLIICLTASNQGNSKR